MRYISYFLALIVILSIVTLYFNYKVPTKQSQGLENIEYIMNYCINLCLYAKSKLEEKNMSLNSECLSDIFLDKWPFEDWVCDVAHWPREDIDDLTENQCKTYLVGVAKNFVEVTPNCTLIRVYYNGEEYRFV